MTNHGPALVTGASGGIGSAIARRFAAQGRDVGIHTYSNIVGAEALKEELESEGVKAAIFQADLRDRVAASQLVSESIDELGDLEVLVHNAGIDVKKPTLTADYSDEIWDDMLAVHLTAGFVTGRAAVRHFLSRGSGVIVNIASIAGIVAWPGNSGYNAAKAGLINLTRTIATEYADKNIRANCVCPGIIGTQLSWDYIESAADPAEAERVANESQPIGRMGTADEIAAMVAFLASDDASYVVGETISVDGGYLAI